MSPPIQDVVGDTVGTKVGSSVFFLATLASCEGEYVVGVYVVSCSVGTGVFDVYRFSFFFLCRLPPEDAVSVAPTFFFLVRISDTEALTGSICPIEDTP